MNLLPRVYGESAPNANATGVTYMRPLDPAAERESLTRKAKDIFSNEDLALMIAPLNTILKEKDPGTRRIMTAQLLGGDRSNRVMFWDNDLSHPGKSALFKNEVTRNLPWILEQAETSAMGMMEFVSSVHNWINAAAESPSVMGTLTDLAQSPTFSDAFLPALKQLSEAGNRSAYSVLLAFAGQGMPDALKQAETFILANRLNVDPDRHGWMQQLGLMLAVRHLEHFEPVKVASTIDTLADPEANPIPFSMAQDLVTKFNDLKGMEDAVHEALREAHDYFEYLYNDNADAAEKDRLKKILAALTSTNSAGLEPISENDFSFLANDLSLPVSSMLMSIAYHGQENPSYFETLEAFAERGKWEMFADDILQVFEGAI